METVIIPRRDLITMLTTAAEAGAAMALAHIQPDADLISQNEAFRRYGRKAIEQWSKDGLIKAHRVGTAANSKKRYSVAEINAIRSAETNLNALNIIKPSYKIQL